ncbi:MAG TPA: hypothetical protein VM368_00520 [Flavisolibacter sp.]|nr:hypothetical protein [Flavisolibacter sp.]
MKPLNFLLVVLVVMITAIGCTTTQQAFDENYDRSSARTYGDRVYIDDPYRGTVILERDPYTGQYFDITNSRFGAYGFNSPYNSWRDRRFYNNTYYVTPRSNGNTQTEEQKRNYQEQRQEARKKILGN